MSERHFAKVVSVQDPFTIVINAGIDKAVTIGKQFLVVGLGEAIIDPDTNESLGALEIVRGKGKVSHVQERMATVTSSEYTKHPDAKEIKRVRSNNALVNLIGPQETVTEVTKPTDPVPKAFSGVQVGDVVIVTAS
ncbi:MAG: hypothetical protein ACJ8G1_22450 [Vitreoscilla sp.]